MGAMKEYAMRLQEGDDVGDLSDIAAALGGDVVGRAVHMASPGRPMDDRPCVIFIDPARPNSFWIYACEGSYTRAKDLIREKLKLIAPLDIPSEDRSAAALRIWAQARPAAGTIVERYLRSRRIVILPPLNLRFHPNLLHARTGSIWPAMVALVTGSDGLPGAIHRTWLQHDGRGKAPVESNKMTLGPIKGGAIRLAPPADGLLVGEGIETCLAAMQVTGRTAWSALSAVGLRFISLPPDIRQVTVLADGDDVGEAAARCAAARWLNENRQVRIARAPRGKDFNDLLIEEASV